MYELSEWLPEDGYDAEDEVSTLDGFTSDDGKHKVEWQVAEIAPNLEYETWWCVTHQRLYFGGCNKVDKPYGR